MAHTSPHTRPLPGDSRPGSGSLAAMLRINHAGEYGAKRIYSGQIAVMRNHPLRPELEHMKAQEQVHLDTFCALLPKERVRPTALLPFWHVAGYALGAGSALLGMRAAMACTVAVEAVITRHYDEQIARPDMVGPALRATLQTFRDEEMEHHDLGLAHEAAQLPFYRPFSAAIKAGCKAAIWLSARL